MGPRSELLEMAAEMTAWRQDLHQNPELGYAETRTAAAVADRLESWGLEVHRGLGKTGVVGVLRGDLGEGPALGLRADMDALPMQEESGAAHSSSTPGA